MKKHKVISWDCLPYRPPVQFTLIVMLILKVYEVPDWGAYLLFCLVGFAWLCFLVGLGNQSATQVPGFGREDQDED